MHVKSDVFCAVSTFFVTPTVQCLTPFQANLVLPDKKGRILSIGGWSFESTEGIRLYTPDGSPGVNGTNDWEENWSEVHLQQVRLLSLAWFLFLAFLRLIPTIVGSVVSIRHDHGQRQCPRCWW
jgi:hypothetical protein